MATAVLAGHGIGVMDTGAPTARRQPKRSVAEHNQALFEAQLRARRGPTPEVYFSKHIDNSRIMKADDPDRRREMRQFSAVMSVLFCLMMVYVWQHFTSIEVGYRVEAQKTQVEQLREQNRQLRLEEAQLTDPQRIDVMAKQLGLSTPMPGQVVRPDGLSVDDTNAPVMAQAAAPPMIVR